MLKRSISMPFAWPIVSTRDKCGAELLVASRHVSSVIVSFHGSFHLLAVAFPFDVVALAEVFVSHRAPSRIATLPPI
jgi:hypothetical protein